MALDMFIWFDAGSDIKGDTSDAEFIKNFGIDVLAWSWGVSNSGTMHQGTGGGAGKANFQDISFTKYIDSSTPQLLKAGATGMHIKEATLAVRKAGSKQEKYLEYTLTNVLITSVSTGGSGGEDRLTENITLNFEKVKVEYFGQDEAGATASKGKFGYDISANEEMAG